MIWLFWWKLCIKLHFYTPCSIILKQVFQIKSVELAVSLCYTVASAADSKSLQGCTCIHTMLCCGWCNLLKSPRFRFLPEEPQQVRNKMWSSCIFEEVGTVLMKYLSVGSDKELNGSASLGDTKVSKCRGDSGGCISTLLNYTEGFLFAVFVV